MIEYVRIHRLETMRNNIHIETIGREKVKVRGELKLEALVRTQKERKIEMTATALEKKKWREVVSDRKHVAGKKNMQKQNE